ncbi:MAG: alpha-amylase family glycosyl hydrolase [Bacteroidales bacterium]
MKKHKFHSSFYFFFLLSFTTCIRLSAQITTQPVFSHENDSVTIIFNSQLGNAGLKNYTGDIYAHTGVITNNSTSNSDWKYVKTSWGQNTNATKLKKIAPYTYELKISPSIRSYYAVPSNEIIKKMAFVFRSETASNNGSYFEGKTADGNDIFATVYEQGTNLYLEKPANNPFIVNSGDTIKIKALSNNADSLVLFHNNIKLSSVTNDSISFSLIANGTGNMRIKAIAYSLNTTVIDSFSYFILKPTVIESIPSGIHEGINYLNPTTVVLSIYAPDKTNIMVVGDFNNWDLDTGFQMKKSLLGQNFWLTINNLVPAKEYIFQYLVDGKIRIGDPYTEKVSDPWNDNYISSQTYPNMLSYPVKAKGIASVLQTAQNQYIWTNNTFNVVPIQKLLVYELLVRDFISTHHFKTIIDSLSYLQNIGINAIELMPVNEFEGNNSWGYNTNYYCAVDKYYGGKNALKALIDSCHGRGIAVILDVVYNHSFGTSPYVMLYWDAQNNRPSINSPFYNITPRHDYNVGYDFNHESTSTQKYIGHILKFWLNEFKVDGFRFDLSKGFTQNSTLGNVAQWGHYDAGRINILSKYADTIWSVNPAAYVILEHFADNDEEKELASKGMMLWGNLNFNFAQAAMGYQTSSDFSSISYLSRGWTSPNVMGYMESHDEERLMYKCLQWGNSEADYNIKTEETAIKRIELNAAFFLTIPGPKMIWQFGELGYDINIDFNGRTGEKPIKWEYFQNTNRYNLYLVYAALSKLKRENPECFQTNDLLLDANSTLKQMIFKNSLMNAVVLGNFDVIKNEMTVNFPSEGIWYDYFTGDDITVTGLTKSISLLPGEYHILTNKKLQIPVLVKPPFKISKPMGYGLFEIFPNPSAESLNIFVNYRDKKTNLVQISFYDIRGRKIGSRSFEISNDRLFTQNDFNYSFTSGIYFCEVKQGDFSETKKIIIY